MHWEPRDAAGHDGALNRRWDIEPIAGDDLWNNNAVVTLGFYMHDWKLRMRMRRHAELMNTIFETMRVFGKERNYDKGMLCASA